MATLSIAEDKICMANNATVRLSSQEIIDCDVNSYECDGGFINKVMKWGRTKGYILEECMPYTAKQSECEIDHLESNICRVESQVYRLNDYCISYQAENIMREIVKNGPVIAQMTPFTDFLAYSEGSYHKSPEAFKFNGQHILKIVGWSKSMDGSTEWIVENTWGADWGEGGYAKILGGRGDTNLDLYSLTMAINPYTQYDLFSMQQMVDSNPFGDENAEYE